MSYIHIDLATLTPYDARGYMALLSHIALRAQEVKAELPPTTLVPSSTSDRIVAEDLMRDTMEDAVKASDPAPAAQPPIDEPKAKRGRPRKDSTDPVTTSATATATNETATPAAPVDQAPEQSPSDKAGAPQAPEASASTSSDQGPDLTALKNALGHVMQHKGGSAGALDLLERFGCRRISEVAELPAAKRIEFVKLAMAEGE